MSDTCAFKSSISKSHRRENEPSAAAIHTHNTCGGSDLGQDEQIYFEPPSEDRNDDVPPGFNPLNIRRCPGCGGRTYLWPCLACQLDRRR